MQDTEVVSALRQALAERIGQERFELWFGPQTGLKFRRDALIVEVAEPFTCEWIRNHFRADLESICAEIASRSVAVHFQINAALKLPNNSPANNSPASVVRHAANSSRNTLAKPSTTKQDVDPRRRPLARLDDFVPDDGTRVALTSANIAAGKPGTVTPLLFHGSNGVGKTHLLEGIYAANRSSDRNPRAVFLSAEQFTSYFLYALKGGGLPNFRRKYRGVELLIIDDLQFFVGKRATIVELQHTVDALLREGRQLVFAADRPLAELADLGPDLTGRLAGGLVCCMQLPGHDTRVVITRQIAGQCEADVPEAVLQYVAASFPGDARQLRGAINTLKATSHAMKQPITLALAEESLARLTRPHSRIVRLTDIEQAVCDVVGLQPRTLRSGGKTKRETYPRMLAMWLARKYTRAPLNEIGHFFGRRSHSTVVSAQKKVEGWLARRSPVALADRQWQPDDAIRTIEQRLRSKTG